VQRGMATLVTGSVVTVNAILLDNRLRYFFARITDCDTRSVPTWEQIRLNKHCVNATYEHHCYN
jgi:hypothetical protein